MYLFQLRSLTKFFYCLNLGELIGLIKNSCLTPQNPTRGGWDESKRMDTNWIIVCIRYFGNYSFLVYCSLYCMAFHFKVVVMKYLPYLLIALCLIFLILVSNDLAKERSERKAADRLHSEEIAELLNVLFVTLHTCPKGKQIVIPLTRVILVNHEIVL